MVTFIDICPFFNQLQNISISTCRPVDQRITDGCGRRSGTSREGRNHQGPVPGGRQRHDGGTRQGVDRGLQKASHSGSRIRRRSMGPYRQ